MADGVILNFVSTRQVKHAVDLVRRTRAEAGLPAPFEVCVFFRATVTDDRQASLPRYQQEMLTYLMSPVYQKFFEADGWGQLCRSTAKLWTSGEREAALAGIPWKFITERALVGRAPEVAGAARRFCGCGHGYRFYFGAGAVASTTQDQPRSSTP